MAMLDVGKLMEKTFECVQKCGHGGWISPKLFLFCVLFDHPPPSKGDFGNKVIALRRMDQNRSLMVQTYRFG